MSCLFGDMSESNQGELAFLIHTVTFPIAINFHNVMSYILSGDLSKDTPVH